MDRRKVSPPLEDLERLRQPLMAGERMVLELFHRRLPVKWEIYIQPHLNGLRPDFVLLNPHAGVAVFEVKDWNLDAMEYSVAEKYKGYPILVARKDGRLFSMEGSRNPDDSQRSPGQTMGWALLCFDGRSPKAYSGLRDAVHAVAPWPWVRSRFVLTGLMFDGGDAPVPGRFVQTRASTQCLRPKRPNLRPAGKLDKSANRPQRRPQHVEKPK